MIFCRIADRFGWTFGQIGELTGPQVRAVMQYLSDWPAQPTMMVEPRK